jgi:hypothetical protein
MSLPLQFYRNGMRVLPFLAICFQQHTRAVGCCMYDSTLHAKTIARQFRKSDFAPGILYVDQAGKDEAVRRALHLCQHGFPNAILYRSELGTKPVYQHRSIEQALVIRHISENLRRVTGVRQSDRQEIIRGVSRLAGQGTAFKAMKLDIRSFYESVDVEGVINLLKRDPAFSRQCVHLLKSFFDALDAQNIAGLPRGLAISATLAEYVMRPFDRAVSSLPGVRYYSRFVDDIIVVLSEECDTNDIKQTVQSRLPSGLVLSRSKSLPYSFSGFSGAANASEEGAIVFLGYRIGVGRVQRVGRDYERTVRLDIAPSKVRKIKTRISRSLLSFKSGGSFKDLLDRFKMITSNYSLVDFDSGQVRHVGIKYNYSLIDGESSDALNSFDRFLLNAITNTHPSNRIRPTLTPDQRRSLLGLTFRSGFEQNRFFSFSERDIQRITRCWSHA